MARSNEINMVHGPLLGKILKFAVPFAASSILQQLFNTIDLAVVGRFASSEALAAVGANTFLINLMINLFVGIALGANVVIARYIGQKDKERIRYAVDTTIAVSVVSGILLLFIGQIIARPVLTMMGTPANILDEAVLYLRIFFIGVPFLMVYNFGAAILRSKGDTQRPLYILVLAGAINAVLNLLFVIGFHMSVEGVAIATSVANLFCSIVILRMLHKEDTPFQVRYKGLQIRSSELKSILRIGIPAGIQGMVFSLSNIFVQTAINGYGSAAVAGASVAQILDSYCYFLLSAFCGAAVTFTGQNYGAGLIERCRKIFWICLTCGFSVILMANILIYFNQQAVLSLFTDDPAVIHYAQLRIGIVLILQWMATFYEIPASSMRGLGHSLEPALLTIIGTCVMRLLWIFFVCPVLPGFTNLMLIYPITWAITAAMVIIAYIITSRKAYRFVKS